METVATIVLWKRKGKNILQVFWAPGILKEFYQLKSNVTKLFDKRLSVDSWEDKKVFIILGETLTVFFHVGAIETIPVL